MNKVLIPVLALAAVGSATFGFIQMNSAGDLAKERDSLKSKFSEQDKALADALDKLRKADAALQDRIDYIALLKNDLDNSKKKAKELAEAGEKNAGLANADAAPNDDRRRNREDIRNLAQNFFKERENNPEFRNSIRSMGMEMTSRTYGALFKKLNLSESDSKLVSELLTDRNTAMMEKSRKLLNGEANEATNAEVRKEMEASKAEYDTKLKGVLGEEKFSQLSTEEQGFGTQRAVDGVARAFEKGNAALQPEQRTVLSDIMREERAKMPNSNLMVDAGGGGGLGVLLAGGDEAARQKEEQAYQERVRNRVANNGSFSPDQVTILDENFRKQNEQRSAMQGFGNILRGAAGGNGGAAPKR